MSKKVMKLADSLNDEGNKNDIKGIMSLPVLKDGETVKELAFDSGKSVDWVRERLEAKAARGELVIGRKLLKNLIGQSVWAPCYKLK